MKKSKKRLGIILAAAVAVLALLYIRFFLIPWGNTSFEDFAPDQQAYIVSLVEAVTGEDWERAWALLEDNEVIDRADEKFRFSYEGRRVEFWVQREGWAWGGHVEVHPFWGKGYFCEHWRDLKEAADTSSGNTWGTGRCAFWDWNGSYVQHHDTWSATRTQVIDCTGTASWGLRHWLCTGVYDETYTEHPEWNGVYVQRNLYLQGRFIAGWGGDRRGTLTPFEAYRDPRDARRFSGLGR